MHRVKRIVAFLVSVILLLLLLCACSNKASHLSDLDDGALRRYMADCGITDGFLQEDSSAKPEYTPSFDLTGV